MNPSIRAEQLRAGFAERRRNGPARHRDIADALGVSEAELIAAHTGLATEGERLFVAWRLRGDWPQIVAALEPLGELLALTRNASCVHEKTGTYCNTSASGDPPAMGLVLGGAIDLRVFYRRWSVGYAVSEATAKGVQRSLQFFDATGTAVHKIFARPATDLAAWGALFERFASDDLDGVWSPSPAEPADPEKPDARIDVPAFRQAWAAMQDTHEFFGLLKTHGVTRTQALRLAEPRYVQRVDAGMAQRLLHGAAASGTPIMVFVGNPGMIQIHSGAVSKIAVMGPWLNVLDEGFNLHLREDHIASAWVVRKPTCDGLVSSLEVFDAEGQNIAMFFGERKPGRPELAEWRELVRALLPEGATCIA